MLRIALAFPLFALSICLAQQSTLPLEIERLTHAEIHDAIHKQGKTTVLIYNGGTEQRGPHAVLGGHTFMARRTAEAIARKLGNALVAPVLPFSPAGAHLNAKWPGSVDLTPDLYAKVNEAVVASMVTNGFKNVVLMGDHGGGQAELASLAHSLDKRYTPQGVHVFFCSSVYKEAREDFNAWLKQHNLPVGTHASIPDTSELMYLGGEEYVRKARLANGTIGNGIVGDPRPSSPELGKRVFDMKVDYGVAEIRKLISRPSP
ncbi:MAG TPA: creatininase family protein [Bryobacteraceae bacterium]|nr:creatininase family protein [Bryobacteraceae bacterium]